jgi:NADH-quinone oxidoreductase subunit A
VGAVLHIPILEAAAGTHGLFFGLGTVLVFALFAVIFVVLNVSIISRLARPKAPSASKETTYECGEPPVGSSWVRFDMRFYSVALIFLIFDVEVAVIYPWALVFRKLTEWGGAFAYAEMFFFVLVVGVGLVYVWVKGDLDWVKAVTVEQAKAGKFAPTRVLPSRAGGGASAPEKAAPAVSATGGNA